jgi:hypothetical protein
MCVLRDLPQQNPRALCLGSSPKFICSHIPMELYFVNETGREEIKKRVVYLRGVSSTCGFS